MKDLKGAVVSFFVAVIVFISIAAVMAYVGHIAKLNDERVWNNGKCSCGGNWVYDQAVGHYADTDYIYKCDSCGTYHEFCVRR